MQIKILFSRLLKTALTGIFILNFSVYSQTLKTSSSDGNWEGISWTPAGMPEVVDDVTINTSVTIPLGTTVEVQNLHLDSNGLLQVNGNLIVYGNVTMANNSPQFLMGDAAVVVVHGDFMASNKIDISVSSYLIIYGSFIKDGSLNQGDFEANDGNIYIFGDVDENWGMTTCEAGYDGTTETTDTQCDYGQQEDFEENQDLIPDELKVLISCFKISKIPDVSTCESSNVVFKVDEVENVTYEWQEKTIGGSWTPTGDTTSVLTLSGVTTAMSENQYRVVLRPTAENAGNCQVGFSNTAVLNVDSIDFLPGPISGETKICLPSSGELTYSVSDMGNGFSYEWVLPDGWSFKDQNASNAPSVSVLPQYASGTNIVKVIVSNTCGQKESQLLVSMARPGEWTGYADTDWNSPSNWGCGIIPDLTTNVVIPDGLSNYPNTNSGPPAMGNHITVAANAFLTVNNFELHIGGDIFNSGIIDALAGSLTMAGNNQQEIPAGTFKFDRIKNLRLNNLSGLLLSGPLEVTGRVIPETGNINSNGNLRLISTATETALIDGSGTGQVLGDVTMQRFLSNGFGYKYFSTPFSNSTVGDFSGFMDLTDPTNDFPHFYSYDEGRQSNGSDASGWVNYANPTNSLVVGSGYAVNFGSSTTAVTVELTGEVNNGQIDLGLQNNNGTYTQGFHLLGNPYPSPVDWKKITRTGMEDAIYFFTAGSTDSYTGTYSSFVNGVSSTDGKSGNIIPSMQGFFVKVADGVTSGTVSFQNSARVNDFSQAFLKKPKQNKPEFPMLRLQAGFTDAQKDGLVIYFPKNAQAGFEADKDAQKILNTDPEVPNFYSLLEKDQKVSISALPFSEKFIPLGIKAERTGEMEILLQHFQNLPIGREIFLLDSETGTVTNLTEKNSYRFNIDRGEYNSRFRLYLSEEKLIKESLEPSFPLSVHSKDKILFVKVELENLEEADLQVSNMSGQKLRNFTVKDQRSYQFTGLTAPGVYIVSLALKGKRYSKKVIFQ